MGPVVLKRSRTRARYHHGVVTEGARRPVTSAHHVAHDACEAPSEKARPLRTTTATTAVIKWSGSLQSKDNPPPHVTRAKGSKNRPSKGAIDAPI
jgi:hypothetical protein